MPTSASRMNTGNGLRGRAWSIALASGAVALAAALALQYSIAERQQREARAEVRRLSGPYAEALRGAVERRIGLLSGFRSFIESRPTPASLAHEFPFFAQGSLTGASGVMAIQYVRDGRIVNIWPREGNEDAIGYDFTTDPRVAVRRDYLRSLSAPNLTVTGPVPLVEGGSGILLRERLVDRAGFPQLAAIVLDVAALTAEAGLPDPTSHLRIELINRSAQWFGGDPAGSAVLPETLSIAVEDGTWSMLAAPADGWEGMLGAGIWSYRLASAAGVLLVAFAGFRVGGREERLERAVAESGLRLDLALRAGKMGVFEWDLRADQVRWSEAATGIFGFDAREVADPVERHAALMHPDDREPFEALVGATVRGERETYLLEYRLRAADGSYRWVLTIGNLERDAAGRPQRIFGIVSDSTERRELEERLRHSQRLESVGKLAGGVAHDFNNLLTAASGFAEIARERAAEVKDDAAAADIAEDLDQIVQIAARGASLTSQLLAFSRRSTSVAARVDVSTVIRELEPMLGRLLGGSVKLRTALGDGLPPVWIDPGQLTQVLMNLAVNARDAMPLGGYIEIRAFRVPAASSRRPADTPPGEWVCIEVEDQGEGMSQEVRARIFEPYFTTKEMGRGTGLGLAVVYGAVENAGGRVTVQTMADEGTTFRVYLPPANG